MQNKFTMLIGKFEQINKKGYIKGVSNNLFNGAGLTLEFLLGKNADSLMFPDYQGIEIKSTQRFSRHPITLFSCSFDGPDFFEANTLLEKYGIVDETYPDKKVLITSIGFTKPRQYGKYFFQMGIDKQSKYIYINIFDEHMQLVEKRGYINFQTLKERFELKLNKMALIYVSKKVVEKDLYFRFYKIECYTLKNFETIIELLEKDKIKLTLMMRISRSGPEAGRQRNKNLVFAIGKTNLDLLFNKIYTYER